MKPVEMSRDRAFSLVELLVVMSILTIIVALLLPAVQSARELSRRTVCFSHARQVALGVLNYTEAHRGRLPAQWRSDQSAPWENFSWRASLLPFVEEQPLHDQLDLQRQPIDAVNRNPVSSTVTIFQCPSTPHSPRWVQDLGVEGQMQQDLRAGATDFVAVHNVLSPFRPFPYRGAWHGGRSLEIGEPMIGDVQLDVVSARIRALRGRLKNIRDGLSKTVLLVEQAGKPRGLGSNSEAASHAPLEGAWATCDYGSFWGNGVNTHNYRDPFGFHDGAVVCLSDGATTLLSESTPREIIVALLSRDGHEIHQSSDW